MNRGEFGRAVNAACAYPEEPQTVVFGPRVIPGSYDTDLCLHPIDLCVAKAFSGRPRDREFAVALVAERIIDVAAIRERIAAGVDWPPEQRADSRLRFDRTRSWLQDFVGHRFDDTKCDAGPSVQVADHTAAEG